MMETFTAVATILLLGSWPNSGGTISTLTMAVHEGDTGVRIVVNGTSKVEVLGNGVALPGCNELSDGICFAIWDKAAMKKGLNVLIVRMTEADGVTNRELPPTTIGVP